jgi:hypothetical protein
MITKKLRPGHKTLAIDKLITQRLYRQKITLDQRPIASSIILATGAMQVRSLKLLSVRPVRYSTTFLLHGDLNAAGHCRTVSTFKDRIVERTSCIEMPGQCRCRSGTNSHQLEWCIGRRAHCVHAIRFLWILFSVGVYAAHGFGEGQETPAHISRYSTPGSACGSVSV